MALRLRAATGQPAKRATPRWMPSADADPDGAARDRQHDRLDQELGADVAALAPIAMRMPISRVRSVTETSMMFMIPMPPTRSETPAIDHSR